MNSVVKLLEYSARTDDHSGETVFDLVFSAPVSGLEPDSFLFLAAAHDDCVQAPAVTEIIQGSDRVQLRVAHVREDSELTLNGTVMTASGQFVVDAVDSGSELLGGEQFQPEAEFTELQHMYGLIPEPGIPGEFG